MSEPSDDAPETVDGGSGIDSTTNDPQMRIHAQYVKDLSFENPSAPLSLLNSHEAPRIEVSVDVQARQVQEDSYEVEIRVTAHADREEHKAFVVEVHYGGLFSFQNVEPEALRPLCLIECPRLLFPFMRRIIADATRDGGFPPLLLEPIDFSKLYRQQVEQGTVPEVISLIEAKGGKV